MLEAKVGYFFAKKLFSNLIEKRQLQMIKYNKKLQNLFNKSLINYKLFSQKHIIYEENNQIKIYNCMNGSLLFEGGFINGKKNGKGKEYNYNGKIEFEGEYLNGKINGKGKKYYFDGQIEFESEYLNGNYWNGKLYEYSHGYIKKYEKEIIKGKIWNIKGFDNNGEIIEEVNEGNGIIREFKDNLIFQYQYLNGEKLEKEKIYYNNGQLKFEEKNLDSERIVKEYYEDGKIKFEKVFINEKLMNIKEYDINNNLINEFKDGNGYIKEYDNYGKLIFEGEYKNGERNGKGKEYISNYLIFEGE